jgi:CRP-like cAMP-binding protein/Flp pilus assembly protein TadD
VRLQPLSLPAASTGAMPDPKLDPFGEPPTPPVPPEDTVGRGVMPIEEFTALASKLLAFSMYREAISLYETAVKLYPENLALKINLARVREMKRRADERTLEELEELIEERRSREDRLAVHSIGTAYLHYRRGELDRARELFEFAHQTNPNLFTASLFLGKIHIGRNDLDRALAALEEARRANPYSEEVQSLLGRLYMERGDNLRAMHAFIDALVLSGETRLDKQPFYAHNIGEISRRLGYGDADIPALIQERGAKFNNLSERIERLRRERQADQSSARLGSIIAAMTQSPRVTKEVLALRRFQPFERLLEEDLVAVHRLLKRAEHPQGSPIFREQESTERLYLVESGSVHIRRNTPFGELVLSSYLPGQVFGEMDFLDGHGHSADAIAESDTVVLTVARHELLRLFESHHHMAVQILSHFWRSLAEHIRVTNEKMKTFFVQESAAADRKLSAQERAKAEKVIIDINRKIALFKEKGLSAGELKILATLSNEERYGQNDLIFAEGDAGSKLYIVLDGKVRISKLIPGVGEEALAILDRGDFFGEMALVDDKPRSADARAHEPDTTVLAIDKAVLEDILASDMESAQQFLWIICRILCQRLREINETIVKWKIMSGGF